MPASTTHAAGTQEPSTNFPAHAILKEFSEYQISILPANTGNFNIAHVFVSIPASRDLQYVPQHEHNLNQHSQAFHHSTPPHITVVNILEANAVPKKK